MTRINIKNPAITINRQREYSVVLIDELSGEIILAFKGTVVKKTQPKGITGLGSVEESLFVKDWRIEKGKAFKN